MADDLDMITSEPVEFELAHPLLGYTIPVALRNVASRWMAIAQCREQRHVGIGATAREALTSALVPLGARVATSLMADPTLFGASIQVLTA